MAGILDKKTRILDIVVTPEGRRQMHDGEFKPVFASFTDNGTFYEADIASGSSDATERIFFESYNLPVDKIIFEVDDSGVLLGYSPNPNLASFGDGGLFEPVARSDWKDLPADQKLMPLTGSEFASRITSLITGSVDNIKKLQLLTSTKIEGEPENFFKINKDFLTFRINNLYPFMMHPDEKTVDVDSAEPLIYDKRLGHAINFQYLPPQTKSGKKYGIYENLEQQTHKTFSELTSDIGQLPPREGTQISQIFRNNVNDRSPPKTVQSLMKEAREVENRYQRVAIDIFNTSIENNMLGQFFEVKQFGNDKKLTKLDVVDRGIMKDPTDLDYPNKHVFFVGKVMTDNYGVNSFINLFTVVFD